MKALITLTTLLALIFGWTAYAAAERTEAAWKAHDARLAAAIRTAEGN